MFWWPFQCNLWLYHVHCTLHQINNYVTEPQDASPILKDENDIKNQCIAKHGQSRTDKKQLAGIKSSQDKKTQTGKRVYVGYMMNSGIPFNSSSFLRLVIKLRSVSSHYTIASVSNIDLCRRIMDFSRRENGVRNQTKIGHHYIVHKSNYLHFVQMK